MSDSRPPVAIGHVRLHCRDLEAAKTFYVSLGMRLCMAFPGVYVLELRGGTHLLLVQSRRNDGNSRPDGKPARGMTLPSTATNCL